MKNHRISHGINLTTHASFHNEIASQQHSQSTPRHNSTLANLSYYFAKKVLQFISALSSLKKEVLLKQFLPTIMQSLSEKTCSSNQAV